MGVRLRNNTDRSAIAAIQWFGIDIGGTLAKCVYFETASSSVDLEGAETQGVTALRSFLKSAVTYGSTGLRDAKLEMSETIGGQTGTLHFIKFATSRMDGFFHMVTTNGLASFPKVVCATGGGAFKFEKDFKEVCTIPGAYLQQTKKNCYGCGAMELCIRKRWSLGIHQHTAVLL